METGPVFHIYRDYNRLQLKESRKYDAAVKWPRWLPCRHAPEKVLSLEVQL